MLGNLPSSVNLFITKIIVWMDVIGRLFGCQSLHLFLMLLHIILMDVDCLGVPGEGGEGYKDNSK